MQVPGQNVLGHIEVCDLAGADSGSVTIYDSQNEEEGSEKDQQGFREYVTDDGGLQIFTVEWATLKDLIKNRTVPIFRLLTLDTRSHYKGKHR